MTVKPTSKVLLKRMLFLELTGILSIVLSLVALGLLIEMNLLDLRSIVVPSIGLIVVFVFIGLSVRYARRDIHRIHELHSKSFYRIGRYLVYLIGLGMIGYTFFLIITEKEILTSIGPIIEAEATLVLGVLVIYYTYMIGFLIENEHLRHERANFWDIFWVILFPVILIAFSVYMLYTAKAETVSTGEPDFELPAQTIIGEFEKNDSLATLKYNGKKVKFASHVVDISGDSAILVKMDAGIDGVTVNCGFDKSQKEKLLGVVVGDSLVLQCSCGTYTVPTDESSLLSEKYLEMTRCNLIQQITPKTRVGTDVEIPIKGTSDSTRKQTK